MVTYGIEYLNLSMILELAQKDLNTVIYEHD